jgi:uronate dehydrogenase
VHALLEDVDAVIHLGGISVEAPFEDLLEANIRGLYNLYSAAQKQGVKRVVYASSNHAVGFHPVTEVVDIDAPLRPDSLYGVTKCFGESLSRYYFDRFGLETVCLRIGSSFEQPKNPRMLVTYLSFRDFIELVRCSLFTNRVGHAIVYGVSDNRTKWVDNTKAAFLGFRPQDSSVQFEHLFPVAAPTADLDDPTQRFQGGAFVLAGPMEPKR